MASVSSVVWLLFLLVLVLFTFGILGTSTFGRAGKLMLNGNYYGWSHLYMVRADQSLVKVFVFHYFCFEGSNPLLFPPRDSVFFRGVGAPNFLKSKN